MLPAMLGEVADATVALVIVAIILVGILVAVSMGKGK